MNRSLLALTAALTLMASPALAQEAAPQTGGIISVSGTGTLNISPDMAVISAGVQSKAKSAKKALSDNNKKMTALFAELEKAGIAKKDIQTSNFNIYPEIVYPKRESNKPPQIVGYNVNNQVTVRIRALENVGDVLTTLVSAGANNMSGLNFAVSNREEKLDEARKAAIADARKKAELYASEIGTKIKRLKSLNEGGSRHPQPVMLRSAKMEVSADMAVPIAQGEMSISVTVNTNWELAK